MFAGVASGDIATNLTVEGMFILGYGVLGIVMLLTTRWIFDHIVFPKIDLKQMIAEGNIAAGILDAGNMVATGTIIFGVFNWVGDDWLTGAGLVIVLFLITQVILAFASRYRIALFSRRNAGRHFREPIKEKNAALAIRFAGFQIGAALAISNVGSLVNLQNGAGVFASLVAWVGCAFVLLAIVIMLTQLIERVVLHGVPVQREVDIEANYGVAFIEAASYVGIGMLLVSLLG